MNVVLPSIQRALGGGLAAQQWVVNSYLLALPGSPTWSGARSGIRHGGAAGVGVGAGASGASSLACALAPSIGALIGARALQGVAGALLVPSALAVIVATFEESERGPAIGSWTAWARDRDRAGAAGGRGAAGDRVMEVDLSAEPAVHHRRAALILIAIPSQPERPVMPAMGEGKEG